MKMSRETKIGIFVVAVLAAAFLVINYLRGEDLLGKNIDIISHYDNVEGLVASNPVHIKGYKAGAVSSVDYDPETGVFKVTCSVMKKFAIPVDSKMTIYSVDLMGGKGIRIDLGNSSETAVSGTVLTPAYAPDMVSSLTNQIGPLIAKVSGAIDSLAAASGAVDRALSGVDPDKLNSAVIHLNQTLENTEKLTGTLAGHSDDIDSLIANLRNTSVSLSSAVEKADLVMTSAGKAADALGNADIGGILSTLKSILDQLNGQEGTVGKLINDSQAYDTLESVLSDIDSLVKKIEENPKKYIRIKVF